MKNLCIAILLALIFTACGAKKKMLTDKKETAVSTALIDSMYKNKIKSKEIAIKYNAKFNDGNKKISVSGQIRIHKDSLIWISAGPGFGIEAGRILLTKDSIKLRNNLQAQYYAGNYVMIEKLLKIPLDFNSIQGIILNELFPFPANQNNFPYSYSLKETEEGFSCLQSISDEKLKKELTVNPQKPLLQRIFISKNNFRYKKLQLRDYNYNRFAEVEYNNFDENKTINMPSELNLKVEKGSSQINIGIRYNKIETNKKLKYPFSIPGRYKKM